MGTSYILGLSAWLSWLSVHLLISAQVMISQFGSLSPTSGSALRVWSLLGILSPPLSAPPPPSGSLAHSLKINKLKKKKRERAPSHMAHADPITETREALPATTLPGTLPGRPSALPCPERCQMKVAQGGQACSTPVGRAQSGSGNRAAPGSRASARGRYMLPEIGRAHV